MSSGQESPSYAKDSIPDILGKDTNAVFSKLHDTFNKFFQWVLGQPDEGWSRYISFYLQYWGWSNEIKGSKEIIQKNKSQKL